MSSLDLQYASVLVADCLRVQPGEEVLIFVDDYELKISSDLSYFIKNLNFAQMGNINRF
ncbi:MAG TPA: hypothetical protein VMY43_07100 [Methanothrix sp.]|nr:hypothetical protein [Methanothrix sp.]